VPVLRQKFLVPIAAGYEHLLKFFYACRMPVWWRAACAHHVRVARGSASFGAVDGHACVPQSSAAIPSWMQQE
jgi:hypothetical protein